MCFAPPAPFLLDEVAQECRKKKEVLERRAEDTLRQLTERRTYGGSCGDSLLDYERAFGTKKNQKCAEAAEHQVLEEC